MSDNSSTLPNAYEVDGTLGNMDTPGAWFMNFQIVIEGTDILGYTNVSQVGDNSHTWRGELSGAVNGTQIELHGYMDASGYIDALLSINDDAWHGTGTFTYIHSVHVENAPLACTVLTYGANKSLTS